MDHFTVGLKINIPRASGHIHEATISALHATSKTMTVEWQENADTKGKEISLKQAITYNPKVTAMAAANGYEPKNQMPTQKNMQLTEERLMALKNKNKQNICVSQYALNSLEDDLSSDSQSTSPRSVCIATDVKNTPYNSHSARAVIPIDTKLKVDTNKSFVVRRVDELREKRLTLRQQNDLKRKRNAELKCRYPNNPNWEIAHMVAEFQSKLRFEPLKRLPTAEELIQSQQITVCVRKRPLSAKEKATYEIDVISVDSRDSLVVHEPRQKLDLTKFLDHHGFRFDYTFDQTCSNAMVYAYIARPLVFAMLNGGSSTCFAYGQTGSGKTHTMGGEFNGKLQNHENGIYAMAAKDVFRYLNHPQLCNLRLRVSCAFFEIYGGKVYDLLTPDKSVCRVLEDGHQQVQVVGITQTPVRNVGEVLQVIQVGGQARTSGQTSANAKSSRSHAIFQILLHCGDSKKVHGKFSIIDLAGNERGADTSSATRQTRLEGAEINKSLLALKECIRAMAQQSSHVPFRGSTLTQVLRDSFIGGENNMTCMIAMISPGLSSCEHTLNTLRYADRVKEFALSGHYTNDNSEFESTTVKNLNDSKNVVQKVVELKNRDQQTVEYEQNGSCKYSNYTKDDTSTQNKNEKAIYSQQNKDRESHIQNERSLYSVKKSDEFQYEQNENSSYDRPEHEEYESKYKQLTHERQEQSLYNMQDQCLDNGQDQYLDTRPEQLAYNKKERLTYRRNQATNNAKDQSKYQMEQHSTCNIEDNSNYNTESYSRTHEESSTFDRHDHQSYNEHTFNRQYTNREDNLSYLNSQNQLSYNRQNQSFQQYRQDLVQSNNYSGYENEQQLYEEKSTPRELRKPHYQLDESQYGKTCCVEESHEQQKKYNISGQNHQSHGERPMQFKTEYDSLNEISSSSSNENFIYESINSPQKNCSIDRHKQINEALEKFISKYQELINNEDDDIEILDTIRAHKIINNLNENADMITESMEAVRNNPNGRT